MAKRKKQDDGPPGAPAWMATFADMVTLLLAFFVMLLSFSSVQESKFQEAKHSLEAAFGVLQSPPTVIQQEELVVPELVEETEDPEILAAVDRIRVALQEEGIEEQVELSLTREGIAIRISTPFLFDPAKAQLKSASLSLLGKLGAVLKEIPNDVRIEGHTDNIPINSDEFPSNWELSAARAIAVLRQLAVAGVVSTRLSAVGFAEFHPVASNADESGRHRNRRVEIFVSYTEDQIAELSKLGEFVQGR